MTDTSLLTRYLSPEKLQELLLGQDTPVKKAMDAIQTGEKKIAFVVDESGALSGCVTDGDIRRGLIRGVPLDGVVSMVMNPSPLTAPYGTSEQTLFGLMNQRSIEQVPLVNEQGMVVDVALLSEIAKKCKLVPLSEPILGERELQYVTECVRTNTISSMGRFINLFEREFANILGVNHAIATCNGTAAIQVALAALGIKPGDEVIVPTLTFVATVNPVLYLGAVPVFVDSEPETWNMDPDKIEEKITHKTRAIIPVHLYGHPARMDKIVEIARKHDLKIIEDATEALGSKCFGRHVGTFGDIGCFSFNGNKLITTGGGGMIVTNNDEYAKRARYLINQARDDSTEYIHNEIGYNFRLSNLHAAIGLAQLERIAEYIRIKRQNAECYQNQLAKVPGIYMYKEKDWSFDCYWMSSALVEQTEFGLSKNELLRILNQKGFQARPFFKPVHTLPPYRMYNSNHIRQADYLYERGVNLPCSLGLTAEDIGEVCDVIGALRKG